MKNKIQENEKKESPSVAATKTILDDIQTQANDLLKIQGIDHVATDILIDAHLQRIESINEVMKMIKNNSH